VELIKYVLVRRKKLLLCRIPGFISLKLPARSTKIIHEPSDSLISVPFIELHGISLLWISGRKECNRIFI
jgi:hypothetical protein